MNKAIIILTPGFAASETDSTCLPMQQQFVKTVIALYPGIEVIIVTFQYPFGEKKYKWFGATIYSFAGRNKGGMSRWFLHQKIKKLLSVLKKENQIIGLLSFWLGECAWVGKTFAQANGLKHCCWILGQDVKTSNQYIKKIRPGPRELVALSDFLSNELKKNHGIIPGRVIPPGIITGHLEMVDRDIDIIGVGSLIALKRFRLFIEILSSLKKQLPGIKALLIGNGPQKEELNKLVIELGLQNNICLKGEQAHEEVIQHMHRSKLLIHPSSFEGFPGVCNEALSAGTKVISCIQPMEEAIENWFIADTKEKMTAKAMQILTSSDQHYKAVVYRSMDQTAKEMMDLMMSDA